MDEIDLQDGIQRAIVALQADRLALLCGAGLSMAAPSSLPSAADLALKAKQKYDATFGDEAPPLPDSIDDQAEFFFERGELDTVYLKTLIDHHAFASRPNKGHFATADLLLTGSFSTAVSTNVDTLIENAGDTLFGNVGKGVSRDQIAALPKDISPLLKIHGCWSDRPGTVWAAGQIANEPIKTRIEECAEWLTNRLLNCDLVIVGFSTDWDYLNSALETSLAAVTPSRVIVVNPCDSASFEKNAPELFALGQRVTEDFFHIRESGDVFLDRLRVALSRSIIRRILHDGTETFTAHTGTPPNDDWLEPWSTDAEVLWHIRRDLEGCYPNNPAKVRDPIQSPLLGLTLLKLRASGAVFEGGLWKLDGHQIRVLNTPNRPLHEVQETFAHETAPVIAPDYIVAVGAEALHLPPSIARGGGTGSIARNTSGRWLTRTDAEQELGL